MIRMRVRQENEFHLEPSLLDVLQHLTAICPRIEGDRFTYVCVPDKISVHGHVVIGGVELREAFDFTYCFRDPFSRGQLTKSGRIQFQNGRRTLDSVIVKISVAYLLYFL